MSTQPITIEALNLTGIKIKLTAIFENKEFV